MFVLAGRFQQDIRSAHLRYFGAARCQAACTSLCLCISCLSYVVVQTAVDDDVGFWGIPRDENLVEKFRAQFDEVCIVVVLVNSCSCVVGYLPRNEAAP